MENLIIGIAGGTGSGKTTLIKRISERFGDDIVVFSHDSYYKAHDDMDYDQRCLINYDSPEAYDNDLFVTHLEALKNGQEVLSPVYDFTVHNRSNETRLVIPKKVIVVEGILILHVKEICDMLDIKIFVDTDADVRLLRRIKRDMRDRGRTLESITQQYLTTVKPMHDLYVQPSKDNADIVVPKGGKNPVVLDIVFQRILSHLEG